MPTPEQINEFKIKIAYGHSKYANDLGDLLAIRGDRNLGCQKQNLVLTTMLKDAIFDYFEDPNDTTEGLTVIEIESIIDKFNDICETHYYIEL